MNSEQAKQILLLYRPGTADGEDPEVVQALQLARQDPELGAWFSRQQAFHQAVREKLRQVKVPDELKHELLAQRRIVRPPQALWQQPLWMAAAAIFVVLLGLALFWVRPSVPDRFTHFQTTMVSYARRMYGMDFVTSEDSRLREFFAAKGAPANYALTQGLAKLQLKGGGLLRWRGNPVSMVCFDRGAGDTLFLFVMKRSALKDPPPPSTAAAELSSVGNMMTASWTQGDDAYLLAGPEESSFVRKYLRGN